MNIYGRILIVTCVLAGVSSVAHAQFSFRATGLVGTELGDWGRTWGYGIGLDEMNITEGNARWFMTLDIGYRKTRLGDGDRIGDIYLTAAPADTNWLSNGFGEAFITIGGRLEPCVSWLGYHQTVNHIVSPFIGLRGGYARLDHDQSGHRIIQGVTTAHGVTATASMGVRIAWGGRPERSLEPDPLIDYKGLELAVDVVQTIWVKNRTVLKSMPGLSKDYDAPSLPTIMFRLSFVFHRAPLPLPGPMPVEEVSE